MGTGGGIRVGINKSITGAEPGGPHHLPRIWDVGLEANRCPTAAGKDWLLVDQVLHGASTSLDFYRTPHGTACSRWAQLTCASAAFDSPSFMTREVGRDLLNRTQKATHLKEANR